jgi:hypothetical protein
MRPHANPMPATPCQPHAGASKKITQEQRKKKKGARPAAISGYLLIYVLLIPPAQ